MASRAAGPLLILVIVLLSGASPISAGCVSSHAIDSLGAYLVSNPEWGGNLASGGDGGCGYQGCYASDSAPPVSGDLSGFFWSLGTGDPRIGFGDDNGAWSQSNWTKQFTVGSPEDDLYYYPAFLTMPDGPNGYSPGDPFDWNSSPVIDGCIADQGETEEIDGSECTCVLLSDRWGDEWWTRPGSYDSSRSPVCR